MTTRRDFLIKSSQLVALGAMGGSFASCTSGTTPTTIKHELPKLSYDYKALEPYIDAQTMEIHHSKHHQGYVNKLNKALSANKKLQTKNIIELLRDLHLVPESLQESIRNNGGGHYNHSLFWESMSPSNSVEKISPLLKAAIEKEFQSIDTFKDTFFKATKSVFGSGWGWLVVSNGKLEIVTTPNQENPISQGKTPLLGLDVWEHAYYLKYQNKRASYIKAWWNIVDWKIISERYKQAQS